MFLDARPNLMYNLDDKKRELIRSTIKSHRHDKNANNYTLSEE